MHHETIYELHAFKVAPDDVFDVQDALANPIQRIAPNPPLRIRDSDPPVWVAVDHQKTALYRVEDEQVADAVFRVVRQRLTSSLALVPRRREILTNAAPTLPLSVLKAKDSVLFAPGCLCFVTERIRPWVGSPPQDLIGKPCPSCHIPIEPSTRIVVCRCGTPYHHETAESHPSAPEEDWLVCFEKVRRCLSCKRTVMNKEYVAWDPTTA